MSLEGTLEELGLGEILQIVSLSRKTGVLFLSSKGRDGSVFFRHGLVVRATASTCQQSLGEVLIQKGVIDLAVLRKGLALQQEIRFRERLGALFVKNFGVSQDIIDEVVREQIENVVFSLFTWSEGTFRFEAMNTLEAIDDTKTDPLQFILDQGLNPQFLAMEAARIFEEKRHAAETGSADGNSPGNTADISAASNAPASPLRAVSHHVVVVDDDGPTLRAIADGLAERGFVVHAMTRSEETLIMVDSLHRGGENPAVLVDLIMPKMDGSGVLGGLELLELLHNNFKELRLIVMADYHHEDAENKIRECGFPFIIKPRRAEVNLHDVMGSFLSRIARHIRRPAEAESAGEWQDRFNLGDELRIEFGEDENAAQTAEIIQQSGGFSLLRGMLEELNNPDLQGGVLLLVLRFASEFLNRAIIFTVNDHIVSGFGQFGINGGTCSGNECVRSIHVPLEAVSMFDEPFRSGQPRTFSPKPSPTDSHVFEQLGGGTPSEIFIGPLISQSRVIGFLYGDNLPGTNPIGDVEPLAIFLAQAGVSIEKSLLERQLHARVTT